MSYRDLQGSAPITRCGIVAICHCAKIYSNPTTNKLFTEMPLFGLSFFRLKI